jgi:glycosyltransferase involved in cell wall biosynthesis
MKVLCLSEDCNPDWTSLPIVAYNYAKALAKHTDLTLVTHIRNKPNIERVGLGTAKIVYIDNEWIASPLHKLATAVRGGKDSGWTIQMAMNYPGYIEFERLAFKRFKNELVQGAFDVVHRITPMTPTTPSPMAKWSPVPFVVGPLNGNLPWHAAFLAEQEREGEWLTSFRKAHKLLPYSGAMYSHSKAILAAFEHTIADVPPRDRGRTINFPEVGIEPSLFARPNRPKRDRLTILFAGRLVPYKLPDVVVRAFAASTVLRQHRLVIAGEGAERAQIEAVIAEHGLADVVELRGHRPQAEVAQMMREAEIFAFPSIRELGAGVVIEAMACGMATVAVDYGGPAELVRPGCGIKIPLSDKAGLIGHFQTALERLVTNPDEIERLGLAAHEHAMAHYTWDAKALKTLEIYDWVLGRRQTRPDFWEPAASEHPQTLVA